MDVFVAELDETSAIEALWVKYSEARSPSLFDPIRDAFDPSPQATFFGAKREDILEWIARVRTG